MSTHATLRGLLCTVCLLASLGPALAQSTALFGDAVALLPVGQWLTVFAKGGVVATWTNTHVETTGSAQFNLFGFPHSASDQGFAFKAGAGASFNVSPSAGLRAEYEQAIQVGDKHTTGSGDIGMLSVGAFYRF